MIRTHTTAIVLVAFCTVAQAADPAVTCESGKLKEAGKYASCRLGAESKAVKKGEPADYSKCEAKLGQKWPLVEAKGEGLCPGGQGDQSAIQSFIDACDDSIASALGGEPLLTDVITCNDDLGLCTADLSTCTMDLGACEIDLNSCEDDLATCEAAPLSQPLKTEQVICYTAAGAVTPCAGTGQDGDIQAGAARTFSDNGDGTMTDVTTGLMWEKLSDDGTIHDFDNAYTWTNAFSVKIATLNTTSFAGYDDWRLPNVSELLTLVDYGDDTPPITHSAFDDSCTPGCTVTTCNCTKSGTATAYWSSTSTSTDTDHAWRVGFIDGATYWEDVTKAALRPVRAVRGGL